MKARQCRELIGLVASVLVVLTAGPTSAGWNYWQPPVYYGNWTNAANWSVALGVPDTSDQPRIGYYHTTTAVVDSATPPCGYALLGGSGHKATILVSDGTLTLGSGITAIWNDSTIAQLDGAFQADSITCGNPGASSGVALKGNIEVGGGTFHVLGTLYVAYCGNSTSGRAIGRFDMSGGAVTVDGITYMHGYRADARSLADCLGSTGTVAITGGTFTGKDQVFIGRDGQGVLDVSGGEFIADGGAYVTVGHRFAGPAGCAAGTINLSGTGSVTLATTGGIRYGSGSGGQAHLNMTGGKWTSTDSLSFNYSGSASSTSTMSIAGGEFNATELHLPGSGYGLFDVSGGTSTVGILRALYAAANVAISDGSVTITNYMRIDAPANEGQTFVLGDGTNTAHLTLEGGSSSTFASGLLVNTNATLAAAGSLNANVTNRGTLAPGASVGNLQLTYGKNLTLEDNSVLEIEFTSTNDFDTITMNGVLTRGGRVKVVAGPAVMDDLVVGQRFTIISNIASAGGEFAGTTDDTSSQFLIDTTTNPKGLDLVIIPPRGTLIILE